jgi:hypothetical protein
MAEDELSAYTVSPPWRIPSHVKNLLSSAFTMTLYLAFRGRWLNLAYGISGVWALDPKLQFHTCISVLSVSLPFCCSKIIYCLLKELLLK